MEFFFFLKQSNSYVILLIVITNISLLIYSVPKRFKKKKKKGKKYLLGRRVDLNDACKAYITISIVSLGTIDNKRNVNVVKVQLLRYFSRPLDSHLHLGFSVGRERKLRPIKRKTFRGNEASVRTFFFSMVVQMKERENIDKSRMFCKKTKKI